MKTSEDIGAISKALCELNSVLNNPKNSTINPFFGKKYAPLGEILAEVRPLLAEHGLSMIQNTLSADDKIGIQTMLLHVSGQYILSDVMWIKCDKNTAQGQGSAITYGRRYQGSAMLSIASEDDDDGNNASKDDKKSEQKRNVTPAVLQEEPKKNAAGEIELKKGDQKDFLNRISKCKSEDHLTAYYKMRAKFIWTAEEIKAQEDMVSLMREQWKSEDKALEGVM